MERNPLSCFLGSWNLGADELLLGQCSSVKSVVISWVSEYFHLCLKNQIVSYTSASSLISLSSLFIFWDHQLRQASCRQAWCSNWRAEGRHVYLLNDSILDGSQAQVVWWSLGRMTSWLVSIHMRHVLFGFSLMDILNWGNSWFTWTRE